MAFLLALAAVFAAYAGNWTPDHVVIVVLENRSFDQVIGNVEMPCLNSLAAGGALMTHSHFGQIPYGIIPSGFGAPLPARPSQTNYLFMMSGHYQGVTPDWFLNPRSPYLGIATNDSNGNKLRLPKIDAQVGVGNNLIPAEWRPFVTPNLGAALIAAGRTFASFCESLPYPHYDGAEDPVPAGDFYRRKHNGVVNWIDLSAKRIPADKRKFLLPVDANLAFDPTFDPVDHRKYRGFVADAEGQALGYDRLPTVSFVIPNEQHDLHSAGLKQGDAWLQAHIKPYADWARNHNSLLVITFDEDGAADSALSTAAYRTGRAAIATIFYGPESKVRTGRHDEPMDHLNLLATILDMYGLLAGFRADFQRAYSGPEAANESANLRPIQSIF